MNANKAITFPHSYKSLFIWFFCTFIIFEPLFTTINTGTIYSFVSEYKAFNLTVQLNSIFSYFMFMSLAYLAFYKYFSRNIILLFVGIILAILIPICIRFFVDQTVFYWIFNNTNYREGTTFKFYFSDNTYFAVYYIPSGILYYFYRRNKALQKAQLEAERLRIEAELTHLRSQVNPHFLFNSLNNIYALAYEKSDKILGAIEGLSELLRYSLYEKAEFVPFSKEWDKALQLIKIEQMRLLSPTNFEINIDEEVLGINIPPVILLPLIENVFKHGAVQDDSTPPTISAYIKGGFLKIQIENKISTAFQKDKQHGIGLDNIKKRLFYAYGDAASMNVLEKEDTFTAKLSIPTK